MTAGTLRRSSGTLLAAGLAALLAPAPAAACAVCYGAAEHPVMEGSRLAILFLLGLTYAVVGGGITMVVLLRKRTLQREREE